MGRRSRRTGDRAEEIRANTLNVKEQCSLSTWTGEKGLCHWCNNPLEGRQRSWCSRTCQRQFEVNHVWTLAKGHIKRRARHHCEHCGIATLKIEVNHINPIRGAGYSMSCHHHLDNLEALCHDCHVKVTKEQRAAARRQP